MNFANAFAVLSAGSAVKRPTWGGYVKKESVTAGFYYTFVTKAGAMYIFKYTSDTAAYTYIGYVAPGTGGALAYATAEAAVAASAPVASTTLPLDPYLFEGIGASDWLYGEASSFESERTGTGTW